MARMSAGGASWRVLSARGYADLSPPEAEHAALELPTDRARYVGVLKEVGDYPARSVLGQRIPTSAEVDELKRLSGRWRAVVPLDDDRALRVAAGLFARLYLLDPLYDVGALLYAAWHDPLIRDEHSRRLAQHAGLLARAAPVLREDIGVLTPEHLPGSWNVRPGWRRPPLGADTRQSAAWAMRTGLVLLYWADRLDAVICATRHDVQVALAVLLGPRATSATLDVCEPAHLSEAVFARASTFATLENAWSSTRDASRRRVLRDVDEVADRLSVVASAWAVDASPRPWRLSIGRGWVPEPALITRRILNGEDPERTPPLVRRALRRRAMSFLPDSP